MKRHQVLSALLAAALCLGLLGCGAQNPSNVQEPVSPAPEVSEPQVSPATETENLVKLCKVWGYTKYMHPTFLLGQKDWDQELLTLIPQVREMTTAEEVNELLHTWFVSLGEIDYKSWSSNPIWKATKEEDKVVIADLSWTEDAAYLGEALAADFAQFPEQLPNVDRRKAPVFFDDDRIPWFDNEPEHEAAYDDPNFRLLGMFRLWNAFEYYYPYLHLLDRDWEELLVELVPDMLAGTDEDSYKRSLWLLARESRDSHTVITGDSLGSIRYRAPVSCIPVEGAPVVWWAAEDSPLKRGDVLLSVDGQTVDEYLEEEYGDHPRKELAIECDYCNGIFCEKEQTELGILRSGEEMTIACDAYKTSESVVQMGYEDPYELLEDNIGYINTHMLNEKDVPAAIEAVRDTQGLVIDLREPPLFLPTAIKQLYAYVLGRSVKPLILARPAVAVPGAYVKDFAQLFGTVPGFDEHYDKPVVVLINEGTGSTGDTYAMVFGTAENAVLMGSNTDGCNGSTQDMPLPGNVWVRFATMGAYHPDGTQTQRTGIAPDIRVEPTIQGIAEGRDEVLEAAVEYIKNTMND